MTKKEREQEMDYYTARLMRNINRRADEKAQVEAKEERSDRMLYYVLSFCAGCLFTTALAMLVMWMG